MIRNKESFVALGVVAAAVVVVVDIIAAKR